MISSIRRNVCALPALLVAANLAGACSGATVQGAGEGTPLVELRIEHDAPGNGIITATFQGATVHMGPAVVGRADIERVTPHARADGLLLDMLLTDEAAQRLHAATAAAVGRRMMVIVAGQLRGAPRIAAPIGGSRQVQVHVEATPEDAELLRDRIHREWPGSVPPTASSPPARP